MRALACSALLLTSTLAHADGVWIAGVQAGTVGSHVAVDDYSDAETSWSTGLAVEVSRRVHPRAAIGARLAINGEVVRSESEHRSMFDVAWDTEYRPVVLGIVASYLPTDRVWVAPWIGIEHDWDMRECTTNYYPTRPSSTGCGAPSDPGRDDAFAYGIGAGIDLFAAAPHRAGLAASITRARGGEYTSVGLSVAYRYW